MPKSKIRVPQLAHEDKPEDERKYRIKGASLTLRQQRLKAIFDHVAKCNAHFRTLNKSPYTAKFDPRLANTARLPYEETPLRERFYWAGKNLKGYLPTEKIKVEIRTELKVGKGLWQQVLKIGKETIGTLSRGEHKRLLDGFGVNLEPYPDKTRKPAMDILGDDELKPVIKIESRSRKILFHPDGNENLLLEIKFDEGIARTFDGFEQEFVEIEIEVKERCEDMTKEDIEAVLDRTQEVLLSRFADHLTPIHHSKVFDMVQHLYGRLLANKKMFHNVFNKLPGDRWAEVKPL